MISTFRHGDFSADWIARERHQTISVCFPARNEERTIDAVLSPAIALLRRRVIDQVLVADLSDDLTPSLARAAGAQVVRQDELHPELGEVHGKGDAMWRALDAITGDVVVFLDADSEHVGEHYIVGLLGPVIFGVADFVKGFYRRPLRIAPNAEVPRPITLPTGGGRVTELCAKPLLRLLYPALAPVHQPLAGEIAAKRSLLQRLPFECDYGVDVGLLIDAYQEAGTSRIAQVDLEVRQNDHQPLERLSVMAQQVAQAILWRAGDQRVKPKALRPARAEEAPA